MSASGTSSSAEPGPRRRVRRGFPDSKATPSSRASGQHRQGFNPVVSCGLRDLPHLLIRRSFGKFVVWEAGAVAGAPGVHWTCATGLGRPRSVLSARWIPAEREPGPWGTRRWTRTVAKADSIGLIFHRRISHRHVGHHQPPLEVRSLHPDDASPPYESTAVRPSAAHTRLANSPLEPSSSRTRQGSLAHTRCRLDSMNRR